MKIVKNRIPKLFCLTCTLLWASISIYSQPPADPALEEILQLAEENVDTYRKGNVLIRLADDKGNPLKGVELQIRQSSQDFLFGSLMFDMTRGEEMDLACMDQFKERFKELFNLAIFPFYWGGYEPVAGHPRWDRIQRPDHPVGCGE